MGDTQRPLYARLGLEIRPAGTASSLACTVGGMALGAANRIGLYAETTASAERLGLVVGGTEMARFDNDATDPTASFLHALEVANTVKVGPATGSLVPLGGEIQYVSNQLQYHDGSGWETLAPTSILATDLTDLSDVTISSPLNGQSFQYVASAGEWQNTYQFENIASIIVTGPTALTEAQIGGIIVLDTTTAGTDVTVTLPDITTALAGRSVTFLKLGPNEGIIQADGTDTVGSVAEQRVLQAGKGLTITSGTTATNNWYIRQDTRFDIIRRNPENGAIYSDNLPSGVTADDLGTNVLDLQSVRQAGDYAQGDSSVVYGQNIDCNNSSTGNLMVLGFDSSITSTATTPSIAIGDSLSATGVDSVILIGFSTTLPANVNDSVFVVTGGTIGVAADQAVVLGTPGGTADRVVSVGYGASATHTQSGAIGYSAESRAINEIRVGSTLTPLSLAVTGDLEVEGGTAVIGTDPGGSETLRVGGAGHFASSGAVRVTVDCTDNDVSGSGLYLRTYSGASVVSNATIRTNNTGKLEIYTGTTEVSAALRAAFDTSGNFIIGTDPGGSELLRVSGAARVGNIVSTSGRFYRSIDDNTTLISGGTGENADDCRLYLVGNSNAANPNDAFLYCDEFKLGATTSGAGAMIIGADPGGTNLLRVGGLALFGAMETQGILAGNTGGSTLAKFVYGSIASGDHYIFVGKSDSANNSGFLDWNQSNATFGVGVYGGTPSFLAGNNTVGFYNTTPIAKPTVTGSKGGNAALASLMTALSNLGLVADSTTA